MQKKLVLFLIILFLTNSSLTSQNFLLPFKSNDQYGLLNNQKKVIIKPIYKHIEYIKEDYFETTIEKKYTEKIIFNGEEQDYNGQLILKGLLKKDKTLIKEGSFDEFLIRDHYIIGVNRFHNNNLKYNESQNLKDIRSYVELFNSDGDEADFGKMLAIDYFYQSKDNIVFRMRKFDKTFDLVFYDFKINKITKRLISNADTYFFVNIVNIGGEDRLKVSYENSEKANFYTM